MKVLNVTEYIQFAPRLFLRMERFQTFFKRLAIQKTQKQLFKIPKQKPKTKTPQAPKTTTKNKSVQEFSLALCSTQNITNRALICVLGVSGCR